MCREFKHVKVWVIPQHIIQDEGEVLLLTHVQQRNVSQIVEASVPDELVNQKLVTACHLQRVLKVDSSVECDRAHLLVGGVSLILWTRDMWAAKERISNAGAKGVGQLLNEIGKRLAHKPQVEDCRGPIITQQTRDNDSPDVTGEGGHFHLLLDEIKYIKMGQPSLAWDQKEYCDQCP